MNRKRRSTTIEQVFIGCSTVKASYERMLSPEQLKNNTEYKNISIQFENLKKRFPQVVVNLFGAQA